MPFGNQHKKCLNRRGFSFKCVCFFNTPNSWQFVWICKNNFIVLFIIAGIPIEISEFTIHIDSLFLQIDPPVL
jgi:hypothetical protein